MRTPHSFASRSTNSAVVERLMRRVVPVFAAAASALALTVAAAQPVAPAKSPVVASAGQVTIHLTQALVVVVDHKEKLLPADHVKPGDLIEYRAVYTNNGAKPVAKLMATLPMPEGLDYVVGSALPTSPAAEVAGKDGKFSRDSGKAASVVASARAAAPAPDYRLIRWTFGKVAAGQTVEVVARAHVPVVIQVGAAASAASGALSVPSRTGSKS